MTHIPHFVGSGGRGRVGGGPGHGGNVEAGIVRFVVDDDECRELFYEPEAVSW